jgi:hypothetical protein
VEEEKEKEEEEKKEKKKKNKEKKKKKKKKKKEKKKNARQIFLATESPRFLCSRGAQCCLNAVTCNSLT